MRWLLRRIISFYSVGKDSWSCLILRLRPFIQLSPLSNFCMSTVEFREMIEFRDKRMAELGLDLIVHSPGWYFCRGRTLYPRFCTSHGVMKTEALSLALAKHRFDMRLVEHDGMRKNLVLKNVFFISYVIISGIQKTSAQKYGRYTTLKHSGESIRVFPLSNWTELNIWQYILKRNSPSSLFWLNVLSSSARVPW